MDNVPLSEFEDEWVQVREEVHYTHDGYYSIRIMRVSDGKVLITDFRVYERNPNPNPGLPHE